MRTIIVYESFFGNTGKIAQAIAEPFGNTALLKKIDFQGILQRVMQDFKAHLAKLVEVWEHLKTGHYKCAGKSLGELLVAILFKDIDEDAARDFVIGFLRGVGITEAIENLMKCYSNFSSLIATIKTLIGQLRDLKAANLSKIKQAIGGIMSSLRSILEKLAPCWKGGKYFYDLITAIRNMNPESLAWNLIKNAPSFIGDIISAINGFQSGNYNQAGNAIGDMTKKLLMGRFVIEEIKKD